MLLNPWLVAALAAVLVLLTVLLMRARAEAARLRRRLEANSRELQHLQTSFARFAPADVVERVIARGVETAAERRQVTVLFADLVGFSELSERLPADVLVRVLNEYFQRMSRVISEHRGHVSKFIGDGIMALFGAHEPNPWQCNDAAHAALAMRRALYEYNRGLERRDLPPLRCGIGIHRGSVVAGVIGSHELLEFTVIGSTVNLASRIERLTREHETDILLTDSVREHLDPRFALHPLDPKAVKGFATPQVTYALNGWSETTPG